MKSASLDEARAAKEKLAQSVLDRADVNGVGIMRDGAGYAVKVNLSEDASVETLPVEIDGVPIHVEVVGPITKRSGSLD